jgi:inosose dehydratase
MKFGVSPIAWSNDDMPELGGETTLESCLTDVGELGFDGVELGGKFPRQSAELLPILRSHGLSLVGGWFSGNCLVNSAEEEIAALRAHQDLLRACGSDVFVYAECSNAVHGNRSVGLSGRPVLDSGAWRTFGERLTGIAEYLGSEGFRFAYHHHTGTVVETAADLEQFLAVTGDAVGLTLDTGHAFVGGIDCAEIIRKVPARIAHVHCKDVRRSIFETVRKDDQSFLDGVLAGMFTVPGDGDIDFGPVFEALGHIRYDDWIIVEAEQDPALANPRLYARLGLDHVRSCAQPRRDTRKVEC